MANEIRPWPRDPRYGADASGAIYSRAIIGRPGPNSPPLEQRQWRETNPYRTKRGYLRFDIGRDRCMVHHVVLECFVGPRPGDAMGRHLDDDSLNNAASNLAWGESIDNANDKVRNGKQARSAMLPQTKLDVPAVHLARRMHAEGATQREIAAIVGVHQTTVGEIVRREIWKHA